jgi:hypothetical protein
MKYLRTTYLFSKAILLFPLIVGLFILDRLLLTILIHIKSENLNSWLSDKEQIKGSIIRVVLIYSILLLIYLFN